MNDLIITIDSGSNLNIDCCNKYGIAMAFTGMRLFHH